MTCFSVENWALHLSALVGAFAIFWFQSRLLRKRPLRRRPESPATFFETQKLISAQRLANITFFFAAPFALLFFAQAVEAKYYVANLASIMPDLGKTPDAAKPFIVLACALLLYLPILRTPLLVFRDLILFVLGIDARANRVVLRGADLALKLMSLDDARRRLFEQNGAELGLPDELAKSPDRTKLGYLLLRFVQNEIPIIGLDAAVANGLRVFDVAGRYERPLPILSLRHLVVGISFFVILVTTYMAVIPEIGPWLTNAVRPLLQHFEWPAADARDNLAMDIVQKTLAFVVPLAIGMYLYSVRRIQQVDSEGPTKTSVIILAVVVIIAFLASLSFGSWFILRLKVYGFERLGLEGVWFSDVKFWVYTLLSACAPAVAFLVWLRAADSRSQIRICIALGIAAGVWFGLTQYVYEWMSTWRGVYWHETIFGAVVAFAFCGAALLAGANLFPPDEKDSVGVLNVTLEKVRIFISYRQSDSSGLAQQLYAKLSDRYERVFMDVETLTASDVLPHKIGAAIRESDLMLALIGPKWVDKRRGKRTDWVFRELGIAFMIRTPVIPIYLDGADTPDLTQLPDTLRELPDIIGLKFQTGSEFDRHFVSLVEAIRDKMAEAQAARAA